MDLVPAPASQAYHAAQHAVAYYRVAQPGALRLGGATRAEYVQRQTTNDVGLLSPQRAVPSVLTNPSARILEVFTLLAHGDHFLLLTQPGHAPGLEAYFKRHLFFNDQVTIEDTSAAWAQYELYGPQISKALAAVGLAAVPALDEVLAGSIDHQPVYALGDAGRTCLLVPAALADALAAQWATEALPSLSFDEREILRIEAGQAGAPEFTAANTPFEVGLGRYVSASKGCYTGQEVLARQVTYDKVARGLVRLHAAQPLVSGSAVELDGRNAGTLSSVAHSPQHGWIGLAVLRKPFAAGQSAQVRTPGGLVSASIQ
ncbi:MAG: hypothetical protein KIT07_05750 [Anaerolineales bacterium]|jgi:folate-binding protein YgfZ|nr:hypothetical protein [Anaerolineales bacterium]